MATTIEPTTTPVTSSPNAAVTGPAQPTAGGSAGASEPPTLQAALGLGTVVGSNEGAIPLLPLDPQEPQLSGAAPGTDGLPLRVVPLLDQDTLNRLQRLASPRLTAPAPPSLESTRAALSAALSDQSYDPGNLPEARAMLLGMARVMLAYGVSRDDLVGAIIDAVPEGAVPHDPGEPRV